MIVTKDLFVDAEPDCPSWVEGAFLSLEESWEMATEETVKDGIERRSQRKRWGFSVMWKNVDCREN